MYIAHVYPITTSLPQKYIEPISYFTKDKLQPRSIVEISFNSKKVPAYVIETESTQVKKTSLKKSTFTLKKVHKVILRKAPFPPPLTDVLSQVSDLYLEPLGSILKSITPAALLEDTLFEVSHQEVARDPFQDQRRDITIGTLRDRIEYYETVIREVLAKKKVIAIFTPTIAMADYLAKNYGHLPRNPVLIHSKLGKKTLKEAIKTIHEVDGPLLIIGTSLMLGCLRGTEHTIVIEDADSHHYTRGERPKIKTTTIIRMFAHSIQARLIEGKYITSLRDFKHGIKAFPASPHPEPEPAPTIIKHETGIWSVISTHTLDMIQKYNERFVIMVSRKGFYSFVLCLDCGMIAQCSNCDNPLAFHTKFARRYSCHHCGKTFSPHRSCIKCNSWNLKGYGVGTESIKEALELSFPGRKFWILDSDTVKNKKTQEKIVSEFIESENGILIGTEMILEDPRIAAEHILIAHMDNLFSIPDIGIHERILQLIVRAREKSTLRSLFIQTRFPDHPLFQALEENNIRRFLDEELKERKDLNFPPYTLLIKCVLQNKDPKTRDARVKKAEELLEPLVFALASYPSYTNKNEHIILLTTTPEKWIKEGNELRASLLDLEGQWAIVVDPSSIL